jgi:hypothetical protein
MYTGQHNTEKRGQTPMSLAGFESMIPVFELSKVYVKFVISLKLKSGLIFSLKLTFSDLYFPSLKQNTYEIVPGYEGVW